MQAQVETPQVFLGVRADLLSARAVAQVVSIRQFRPRAGWPAHAVVEDWEQVAVPMIVVAELVVLVESEAGERQALVGPLGCPERGESSGAEELFLSTPPWTATTAVGHVAQ